MRTPYYECHITVEPQKLRDARVMESKLEEFKGWSLSNLNNDILIGPGAKLYATAHFPTGIGYGTLKSVKARIHDMARELSLTGLKVIRQKIELVVFDTAAEEHNT